MALIDTIRKKFNQFIADLNCLMNGHANLVVIDTYDKTIRGRNFSTGTLKKLCAIKPIWEEISMVKCACRSCNRVFLETRTKRVRSPY